MSKRFTDTDKWKKPFIRGLDAPYKLLWLYMLDDCDHAGIWIVDIDVANLRLGMETTIEGAKTAFGDHIIILDDCRWLIRDFVEFQYGELNPGNRAHNSVIQKLKKVGIDPNTLRRAGADKPLISPLQGAKDKDKDKDKDSITNINNTTNARAREGEPKRFSKPTISDLVEYAKEYCADKGITNSLNPEAFLDYYDANGWFVGKKKMKDWRATVRGWIRRENETKNKGKQNGRINKTGNPPGGFGEHL